MITPCTTVPALLTKPPRHEGRADGLRDFARAIYRVAVRGDYSLLDVGAGDGWLGEFTNLYYTSIDLNAFGAKIQGDAHALPFRDASFDLVVSKQTLPHFNDPQQALAEMCRVARCSVIVRQEFPDDGPIGWEGHSRVRIESSADVLSFLSERGFTTYDGVDFVVLKRAAHAC